MATSRQLYIPFKLTTYYRDPEAVVAVGRWTIQTGPTLQAAQPRALFELRTTNWDVAPDGKRFLVVKEPQAAASEAKLEAVVNWFEELRQKVSAGNALAR